MPELWSVMKPPTISGTDSPTECFCARVVRECCESMCGAAAGRAIEDDALWLATIGDAAVAGPRAATPSPDASAQAASADTTFFFMMLFPSLAASFFRLGSDGGNFPSSTRPETDGCRLTASQLG